MLTNFKLNNSNKRAVVTLVLVLLILGGGVFSLIKNVFKADTVGAFTMTGTVYDQVKKSNLSGVTLSLFSTSYDSTTGTTPDPIIVKTDTAGRYSVSAPDASYTNLSITKEGFWDMEGNIVNVGALTSITANLTMKPGFGKEDIQLTAFNKTATGNKAWFGLSVDPWDNKQVPASVEPIASMSTYTTSNVKSTSGYDLDQKGELNLDTNNFQITPSGNLPELLTDAAAVYSPETDKYYIFGGKRSDGTLSNAIYEYDRNKIAPESFTKVATMPYDNAGGSAIYISSQKQILYFAGKNPQGTQNDFYSFSPQTNYTLTPTGKFNSCDKVTAFIIKDKIFLSQESNHISTISASPTSTISTNAQFTTSKQWSISVTGFSTFYDVSQNNLYIIGGTLFIPTGPMHPIPPAVQDAIYVFNPDDTNSTPTAIADKLPYPLTNAIPHKVGNTLYLIGGQTTGQSANITKMITVVDNPAAMSFSGTKDINLPDLFTNAFASVEDNSNRTIIFSSAAAGPAQQIHTIAPVFSLKSGQSYGIETSRPITLLFKGKSKTDTFTFTNKDINEANWDKEKSTVFANPYSTDITVGDITVNYNNTDFTLAEASDPDKNIIAPKVWLSGYPAQAQLNLTDPDQVIKPGEFIAFFAKKSGVKVRIDKNSTATGATSITVDVPSTISYTDLKDIMTAKGELNQTQRQKLDLIKSKTESQLAAKPASTTGDIVHVDLTVNGKYTFFNQPNPAYFQKTTVKGVINKTHASDSTDTFNMIVNKASFTDEKGVIDPAYQKIQNLIDSFEQDGDEFGKIKAILGEPYFIRTIKIEKAVYHSSSAYSFRGDYIIMNTEDEEDNVRGIEGILLHEISHSWRGLLGQFHNETIEEGFAQGFVYAFDEKYRPSYLNDNFEMRPVYDFDQWEDSLSFFNDFIQVKNDDYADMNLLYDQMYFVPGRINLIPKNHWFWTRQMAGSVIMKFYLFERNNNFFKNFAQSYYNYLLRVDPEHPRSGYLPEKLGITTEELETKEGYQKIINKLRPGFADKLIVPAYDYFTILIDCSGALDTIENWPKNDWLTNKAYLYVKKSRDINESKSVIVNYKPSINYPAVKSNLLCKYPKNEKFCLYEERDVLFFSKAVKTGKNYNINSMDNEAFITKIYFGEHQTTAENYTDINGAMDFSWLLNYPKQTKITRSIRLLNIQKNYTEGNDRIVQANNLFMQDGKEKSNGLYGVTDLPNDTEITLEYMKIGEGPQYLTTYVQNGIYVIPNAEAISGEVDIKNSFNDNSLSTIKFYGDMQYDIITDKIAPFMDNISNDTSTIKAQLSEPASIFVEYGNKEGDYTDISFGKADAGNFEGDAVAEGDRQIQTDDFVIPAPFHYRIWAIDKSGNISHSEDQVFEDKTIKNITVTNINNTSATISWETSADSLGKIEYGGSTNYGSASSESAKSKTHSIKLTGLSYNTTYHFRIKAYEEGKEDGAYYSDNQTFSTQTFRISNLRYDRSSSDVPVPVRITWETNAPATCSISGSSSNPDANGTTHEYTMSVAPNVYTLFTVTCTKTGATQTASASGNFTVPLSIDHQSSNPESNGTTLSWTQSLKIPGKIKYYTWWQPSIYYYADYPAVTNQSVTLTDVKPGTVYDWVIIPDPTYIQLSADFAGGNFRTPCPILTNFTSTPIARASDKLVDILMTWDANIKTKGKVTYSAAYGGVGTVYFNENQTQVTMGSFLPGHTYTYTIYTEPYTYTQPYSSPPYTVTGCSAGGVFTAPSISSSGSSAMASPSSVALTPDDSVSRSTSTTSISTNTSTYEKVINKIKTLWGALSDIKIFKLIQGL